MVDLKTRILLDEFVLQTIIEKHDELNQFIYPISKYIYNSP